MLSDSASFALYLSNVPLDMDLDMRVDASQPDVAVLDIKTPAARMELSIRKEIWTGDGDWKRVALK